MPNNTINPNNPTANVVLTPEQPVQQPSYYTTSYSTNPYLNLLYQQSANQVFNGTSSFYYPPSVAPQSQGYFAQLLAYLAQYFPFLQQYTQPGLPGQAPGMPADPNALAPGEKKVGVDGEGNLLIEGTRGADQILAGQDDRGPYFLVNGTTYRVTPEQVQKLRDGAKLVIRGGGGDDLIDVSAAGDAFFNRFEISGDDGNDEIIGSRYNDRISGGDGRDTIDSGDGNDRIDSGKGVDNVTTGSGDDYVFDPDSYGKGQEADTIDGGDGRDRIAVGAGFNVTNTEVVNGNAEGPSSGDE